VINLNATARASKIIRALPYRVAVTDNALAELTRGARNGYDDAERLQSLINRGMVDLVRLGDTGRSVYAALVEGTALRTLDDGEAATIGYACEVGGIALVDERKARSICRDQFPALRVLSTVDILMHEMVAAALGPDGQADAIISALIGARMRVPKERLTALVDLIGEECIASFRSLPKATRIKR
jgi:predicted nucleic acid-binding protein